MAVCDSEDVGDATRIWAFAHVMKGARIGTHCNIGGGSFVESGAVLGDRVTLKNQAMVWDGVQIDEDVFVGPGVIFTNDAYPRSPRMPRVQRRYADPAHWRVATLVGQGASLGAGAVIGPGVRIGAFAMVGAGAVVTRDVPAYRLVVGNPARPIGWVCACGRRLDPELACSSCGAAYRLGEQETLVPA
jgi:acetyltransferase-like isoleucine patch superfamily enzyme